jgi:hypothetical protein
MIQGKAYWKVEPLGERNVISLGESSMGGFQEKMSNTSIIIHVDGFRVVGSMIHLEE